MQLRRVAKLATQRLAITHHLLRATLESETESDPPLYLNTVDTSGSLRGGGDIDHNEQASLQSPPTNPLIQKTSDLSAIHHLSQNSTFYDSGVYSQRQSESSIPASKLPWVT